MKNIVITGSSRGLGYEMAKLFLEHGCNITIAGKSEINLRKATDSLQEHKKQIFSIVCDVCVKDNLVDLWEKSVEHWGKVDIWINNAGMNQLDGKLWELTESHTKSIIQTNLMGVIYGSQVAMNGMLKQGHGQIYNVEGMGSDGRFEAGVNLYGTTKRALTYYTKALALEAKNSNVLVGRLNPGMMVTDLIIGEIGSTHNKEYVTKIFNIWGDKPCIPAQFLVDKILHNKSNNASFSWLTKRKAVYRLLRSFLISRDLFTK